MQLTVESMTKLRLRIYRLTLLMALATGGVAPAFRHGIEAKILGVFCVCLLVFLAAPRVLRISSDN